VSPLPWQDPLLHALVLLVAVAIDLRFGEPPARIHPVIWMGRLIKAGRDAAPSGPAARFVWGLAMAIILPTGCALAGAGLVMIPWIGPVIAVWLLTSSLSIRVLGEAGVRVGDAVAEGRIEDAREGLSWLCSRSPEGLTGVELAGAATESVAENASDSAVAPLLWFLIGGVPGAVLYRCMNTLDAMIGYRDRYFWLGKASARLDDALNLIPARLTAVLMLLLADGDRGRGARCMLRDASKTDSPNAGWPMAAMAGILGVQLTKRDQYTLGDDTRPIRGEDVRRCWRISRRAMVASAILVGGALLGHGLTGQGDRLDEDVAILVAAGAVVEEAQDDRP
jgi:adenosylcobinamide-phosphate synthase